jgi:hypothetical protein
VLPPAVSTGNKDISPSIGITCHTVSAEMPS